MVDSTKKNRWLPETSKVFWLLLKASIASLGFPILGAMLAPLVLIGMLLGWFPNAITAAYSCIFTVPLLLAFPFQALYFLVTSLLGRVPNYGTGIYRAAHWIEDVRFYDPTVRKDRGKWPAIVIFSPVVGIFAITTIIASWSTTLGIMTNRSLQQSFEHVGDLIEYSVTNKRHRKISLAIKLDRRDVVEEFLAGDLSPDKALLEAALYGNVDLAKELIEQRGASIHVRGLDGDSVLHEAAVNGQVEMLRFLISYGVDIEITNKYGQTPLHRVTIYNMGYIKEEGDLVATIGALIKLGANVNARTIYGTTPLHYIAETWPGDPPRLKCAKLLIDSGAQVYMRDNSGRIPLDFANTEGMKKLLNEYMEQYLMESMPRKVKEYDECRNAEISYSREKRIEYCNKIFDSFVIDEWKKQNQSD